MVGENKRNSKTTSNKIEVITMNQLVSDDKHNKTNGNTIQQDLTQLSLNVNNKMYF